MALHELGISAPVAGTGSEYESRAVILNNYYETARDEVLKANDWNFAQKYRVLTPSNRQNLHPKFMYMFDYPNDCLNARELYDHDGDDLKKEFQVSADDICNKVIYCNVENALLKYTRRITDEQFFDAEFSNALALYLAALTGQALTGSQQKADDALKKYWDKVRLARISNTSEGQELDEDNTTYLDAR